MCCSKQSQDLASSKTLKPSSPECFETQMTRTNRTLNNIFPCKEPNTFPIRGKAVQCSIETIVHATLIKPKTGEMVSITNPSISIIKLI